MDSAGKGGFVSAVNAVAGVVVVAAEAERRISLKSVVISTSAAATVWIEDEHRNIVFPKGYYPANGGIVITNLCRGRFKALVGDGLKVWSSGSDVLSCVIEAYNDTSIN